MIAPFTLCWAVDCCCVFCLVVLSGRFLGFLGFWMDAYCVGCSVLWLLLFMVGFVCVLVFPWVWKSYVFLLGLTL